MDLYDEQSEHRKKRRRREVAPRPLSSRLKFDETITGDAAQVSSPLWNQLCLNNGRESKLPSIGDSSKPSEEETYEESSQEQRTTYIALAAATPLHTCLEDYAWVIVAAEEVPQNSSAQSDALQADIRLSPKSSACAALLRSLAALDQSRHGGRIPKTVEIMVIFTKPLELQTVYVNVEKGIIEKVDEIQNKFGGGFQQHKSARIDNKHNLPSPTMKAEDRLRMLVRQAISNLSVIHCGDDFQLPLPSHPITHARPPPATAVETEPVTQGRVSSNTKIIVIQAGSSQTKAIQKLAPTQPIIEESLEDTAEDTSNDQFYSAAEDKQTTTGSEGEEDEDANGTEDSDHDDSDDDSDSMEDMISLAAPGLPPQQAGTLSAMTSATPRPGDMRSMGGVKTPGSVYSSFSASTARAGNRPGKVFKTEALLRRIPNQLLHPAPPPEEDEESFVFVDTTTLAKIGCFSGDWVRIEVSKNVTMGILPFAALNALRGLNNEEDSDWRTVRIFGLSGLADQKPRYAVDKTGDRKSSFSNRDTFMPLTPSIYLSPVLLANLNNASFVKVGALPKPPKHDIRQRPATSKSPPFARSISLLKISTPVTVRGELQNILFSDIKRFFETRRRIVKKGDLIAVPVDQELGSLISSPSGGDSDKNGEELADKLAASGVASRGQDAIAWYQVRNLEAGDFNDRVELSTEDNWGGVSMVDVQSVRMQINAGPGTDPVSDSVQLWTRYWLGMKTMPRQTNFRGELVLTPTSLPQLDRLPLEKRLRDLATAAVSPRAVTLGMPALVILLHSNQRQVGKTYTANAACSSIGVHTFTISADKLLAETAAQSGGGDGKTEAALKTRADIALSCGPQQTAIVLQHIDILTAARIQPVVQGIIDKSRVFIATTSKIDDIPDGIRGLFTHEFEISAPNEISRELILQNVCSTSSLALSPSINLKNVALQTAALVAGDLVDVVNRASLARFRRLLDLAVAQSVDLSDVTVSGGQFTSHIMPSDFTAAISAARSTFSDAIGAPKIPTVTWADLGGLASQKDAIIETISLPLTRPELFANGIRKRSGILFYGPPGTGKTLLAKAIATEFSLNFFSVKGPELLNMYIGESEANVRRVFQRARDARPCVVFFDELDSVAPKRGNQGDSGGVMDRIVSQLLAELDGMSSAPSSDDSDTPNSTSGGSGVFVIGATNRPDLLDPALLRPGRFDKMLYLGVASDHNQQTTIMKALTRKFNLAPSIDLSRVASKLPFTYTGADLYALCSDAMLKAITRKTEAVDKKVAEISRIRGEQISTGYFFDHLATSEDTDVVVEEQDFEAAQQELVGSVSAKELQHFERVRGMFEEQDISAGTSADKGKSKPNGLTRQDTAIPLRPASKVDSTLDPAEPPSPLRFSTPPQQRQLNSSSVQNNRPKPPAFKPSQHTSYAKSRIANPDSGAESSDDLRRLPPTAEISDADISAAGESDFGISNKQYRYTANGSVPGMNGGINMGKGKGKSVVRGDFHDGDEEDDDSLYD